MPGQPTFFGHGDNPRLFADNQGDRVGGLCDAQSRAMPRAQFPADAFSFAEGEETPCGHDLVAAYHDRPVVQRYVFPPPGRIARIDGLDEARRAPGVSRSGCRSEVPGWPEIEVSGDIGVASVCTCGVNVA